jgi:LysM repeat protein
MDTRPGFSVRLIAPAALIAFGIALMIVVATGGGHHKGSTNQPTRAERRDLGLRASGNRKPNQAPPKPNPQQAEYVVQTGDTLGSIASKTGVSVDKLQQLNPHLDPQALVSGQRIKLR